MLNVEMHFQKFCLALSPLQSRDLILYSLLRHKLVSEVNQLLSELGIHYHYLILLIGYNNVFRSSHTHCYVIMMW